MYAVYILHHLVQEKWLPVLTSPQGCPTSILVTTTGPKSHSQKQEWIRQYCEMNGVEGDEKLFKLLGVKLG